MVLARRIIVILALLPVLFVGCESLKASKPILPLKDYERMIAGRLDANYVGTQNCLAACHVHDKIKRDFDASTMGMQLSGRSGMPLVNCESCHGPGSLAIEGLTPEKIEADAKAGKQTACDYKTLIDLKNLPSQAKSLICLKCHTANATFNLHNWNAGAHAVSDVSCSDCHNIHAGYDLKVEPKNMAVMCEKCHQEVKAEFALPSHHPVPEKRVVCSDCHDTHGSVNDKLLKKSTVKETCTQCHAEKEGPFVYEHAENMEDCRTCHNPHGSVNNNLLAVKVPFLCLQCHEAHAARDTTGAANALQRRVGIYTRCTDCHSQIHGTDRPSPSGKGRFIQ
ncbi:MAG: DmsE family decaheme c-type cytochrome [Nitrospirae bacterium]|nr:DmsE family decaheme c-type cytochrome [Nitrospirota bacterium]